MSKRQDKKHKESLVRIAAFDALDSMKKKAFTKPKLVSNQYVKKTEGYDVEKVVRLVALKGCMLQGNTIFVRVKPGQTASSTIGIGTKGKLDFLRKMGFSIVFS